MKGDSPRMARDVPLVDQLIPGSAYRIDEVFAVEHVLRMKSRSSVLQGHNLVAFIKRKLVQKKMARTHGECCQRNAKCRRFDVLKRTSGKKNLYARGFGEGSRERNLAAILPARQLLARPNDLWKIANNPFEAFRIFYISRIGIEVCSAMAAVIEYSRSRFDQTSEPKHYRVVKRKRS